MWRPIQKRPFSLNSGGWKQRVDCPTAYHVFRLWCPQMASCSCGMTADSLRGPQPKKYLSPIYINRNRRAKISYLYTFYTLSVDGFTFFGQKNSFRKTYVHRSRAPNNALHSHFPEKSNIFAQRIFKRLSPFVVRNLIGLLLLLSTWLNLCSDFFYI